MEQSNTEVTSETRWQNRTEAVSAISMVIYNQGRKSFQSSKSSGSEVILLCCGSKKVECEFKVRLRRTKVKGSETQEWYIPKNGLAITHGEHCEKISSLPRPRLLLHSPKISSRALSQTPTQKQVLQLNLQQTIGELARRNSKEYPYPSSTPIPTHPEQSPNLSHAKPHFIPNHFNLDQKSNGINESEPPIISYPFPQRRSQIGSGSPVLSEYRIDSYRVGTASSVSPKESFLQLPPFRDFLSRSNSCDIVSGKNERKGFVGSWSPESLNDGEDVRVEACEIKIRILQETCDSLRQDLRKLADLLVLRETI